MSLRQDGPRRWGWAALLASAALGAAGCGAPSAPVPPRAEPPVLPFSADGFTLTQFSGDELTGRLHADQLLVVPKRFGILRVATVGELVLTGVRFEVFERTRPAPSPGAAVRRREAERAPVVAAALLPRPSGARHVVAASVFGLEWTVHRDGVPIARIEADRARADAGRGEVALRRFQMVHLPTGRRITASRALWRAESSTFSIPGAYELHDGGRVDRGRGLRFGVDLPAAGGPARAD